MSQSGLVAIALAGLWIVYLVPQLLRHRQQLAGARIDDRFSEHLRVVRVAEPVPAPTGPHASSQGRVQLHPRGGDRAMHRPQSVGDRVSADAYLLTASEHAARAAALRRRAAGARRRATLSVLLLMTTVAAWVAVAATLVGPLVAAAPTVLLAAVLVAGRRAVLAGRRADASWAEGAARRAARPRPRPVGQPLVVGWAVRPSEAVTEVIERVPVAEVRAAASRVLATGEVPVVADAPRRRSVTAERSVSAPAARPGSAGLTTPAPAADHEPGWVPVPVPPPAYTLKPEARRPEPRPLTGPQQVAPGTSGSAPVQAAADAEGRPTTGGLGLDEILARRRAAGE